MRQRQPLTSRIHGRLWRQWELLNEKFGGDRDEWSIGIQTYRSYGTPTQLRYSCRVLRETGLDPATIHDSVWQNVKSAFHHFESDEVGHARIEVTDGEETVQAESDAEGYARGTLQPTAPRPPGWHRLNVLLNNVPYGTPRRTSYPAACLVPSGAAQFGIISDLDDTVLHSQVTRRWKMVMWSVLHNAYTRVPLPGVGRLYRRLARVDGRNEMNPTFYVSSSPWNLYSMLVEFLDAFDLPRGPVLLRDLGVGKGSTFGGNHDHKEEKIIDIMRTYENLPFLLLGDSGQHDAEIYSRIARRYPGRVLCCYIRNVGWFDRGMIDDARRSIESSGSELVLVDDSLEIEQHAQQRGWITPPDTFANKSSQGDRDREIVPAV